MTSLHRSVLSTLALGVALLLPRAEAAAPAMGEYTFFHENVLGTSCELRVSAESEDAARWAEQRVLGEVDRLAAIFSGYDRSSEFSRWQATAHVPTRVSKELFEVLQASDAWREQSHGTFDPRVEALSRLWSAAAREDRLPTSGEIAAARALMSPPAYRLDPAAGTAERTSACPLSLNGIAKGAIVDRAVETVLAAGRPRGIRGLLLNIGGDLRVAGEPARRIGIASPGRDSETTAPIAEIEVRGASVATSGNYHRGFDIQGRHYSHVFDPRTGWPVERTVSATVIAPRGADADALAKTFSVLPPAESLVMAESLPGVACLLISDEGAVSRSQRWPQYERTLPAAVPLALARQDSPAGGGNGNAKGDDKAAPAWEPGFELLIGFEINHPDGNARRYRRPYVAVWMEDKDGVPVRTLTLWVQAGGPGPRWIPELRRWYRGDQVRRLVDTTNLVDTTARATRMPGKHEVIWDGKDDRGQPLPAGKYFLCIEAAREHGSYQLIRQSFTLANEPLAEELKGNVEIKSANIAYRRKKSAR